MTPSHSLVDDLMAQLQGAPMNQMAEQLGTGVDSTQQAVGAALPMLFGAMGHNAAQPQGANALLSALQNDHAAPAGSSGFDLGGLLGSLLGGGQAGGLGSGSPAQDGSAILGHIFGGRQGAAATGLGQATGLGGQAGPLLAMLAPIVMSYLANRVRTGGMDAGSLGQTLGREHDQVRQQGGLGGGLLGSLLDRDGDGQVGMGDLLNLGGSLLGGRR